MFAGVSASSLFGFQIRLRTAGRRLRAAGAGPAPRSAGRVAAGALCAVLSFLEVRRPRRSALL